MGFRDGTDDLNQTGLAGTGGAEEDSGINPIGVNKSSEEFAFSQEIFLPIQLGEIPGTHPKSQ